MSRRDQWKLLYQRFDPMSPPADPAWRVERRHGPTERIFKRLNRGFEDHRILLSGTIGAGKTTELRDLARRRAPRDLVVFFDVEQHMRDVLHDGDALRRMEPWELAVLIGLAVAGAAKDRFGERWKCESLARLEAAWSVLVPPSSQPNTPRLSMSDLAGSIMLLVADFTTGGATTALKVIGHSTKLVKWDRPIGLAVARPSEQDPAVKQVLAAVNSVLSEVRATLKARATPEHRTLVILDGLDRIRSAADAKRLLLYSESIARLECQQVITAPYALRHDLALTEARGYKAHLLVNEPVLRHDNPDQPNDRAIDFFRDLYARRTGDMSPALLTREQVSRLAYYSGGLVRDFMKLIREAAGYGWDEPLDQMTDAIIEKVIDEMRRDKEHGLFQQDVEILQTVADNPSARLDDEDGKRVESQLSTQTRETQRARGVG